ncbi:DNA helicase MCM8 [Oopsacas minuta]|uniref:DNA helicase MCM8 n=1 Tax=Oopsacas minuta TaxID=111878 RepID=A0AAV7JVQ8_9METZ|nr:DNA helicase MCM8 [Oopsacas minuta]
MSGNNWRGYRGTWRGGWNSSKRGSSYNSFKNNTYLYSGSPSISGNQTPTHSHGMDFLTPENSPFIGSLPSTSDLQVLRKRELEMCPFESWEIYLPSVSYESGSEIEKLVTIFLRFFSEFYNTDQFNRIKSNRVINLDHNDIIYDPDLVLEIPCIAELIRDQPERVLGAIGLAIDQILSNRYTNNSKDIDRTPLTIQLYNYSPITTLNSLRSSQYEKCVSVIGVVIKITNIRPRISRMAFLCSACKGVQVLSLLDGKYRVPTKCLARGCRGKSFFPMKTSPLTESAGWQSISIHELVGGDGVMHKSVECELNGCLVDSCIPGDVVTITAVVKASSGEQERASKERKNLIYLRAISVIISISNKQIFNEDDLSAIRELQKIPNLFKLITNSLSPTIYGHEVVKAGLVLGLFGGVTKQKDEHILMRGESHVLVVGDPGQGMNHLLQAVSTLTPRSLFVCGSSATAASLTITLTKEPGGGGDYTLEAGALVLGDCGVCCIDEFEKMNTQQLALIEAMEQQYIRVSKSGIICNLPARTSIIAAANPVGGHYNKTKTVSENLKMNSSLLSR